MALDILFLYLGVFSAGGHFLMRAIIRQYNQKAGRDIKIGMCGAPRETARDLGYFCTQMRKRNKEWIASLVNGLFILQIILTIIGFGLYAWLNRAP